MPKLINLRTSKVYVITQPELDRMKLKKHIMRAFRVEDSPEEPDAVKNLKHVKAQDNTK